MINIVDYEFGGASQVADALSKIGVDYYCSKNEADISRAEKIILPGVEQAGKAIKKLHLLNLFTMLRIYSKPVLGIGLGMQLMSEFSKEGDVACLGIFPGTVEKFPEGSDKLATVASLNVKKIKNSPLFKGVDDNTGFYFCNKYYLNISNYTTSTAFNGVEFTASLEKDNLYGVQFHPEISGEQGLTLLKNFCSL